MGTDLNLQFPADWQEARKIKYSQGFNKPVPRNFVGFKPLSSVETRAIYQFTLLHRFKLILAYHSQGEVIYWQYQNYTPENSFKIVNLFSEVSGYKVDDVPYNSSFAGYRNWFYSLNKSQNFKPSIICALHTLGRDLKWNPHIHMLISEGASGNSIVWKEFHHFPYLMLRKKWQTTLLANLEKFLANLILDLSKILFILIQKMVSMFMQNRLYLHLMML